MQRLMLAATLVLFVPLTGCMDLLAPDDPCPDEALKNAAYNQAIERFERMLQEFEQPFAMILEGTIEGDIDTIYFGVNPAVDGGRMRAGGGDLRMRAPYLSVDDDETSLYGRDYNPAAGWRPLFEDVFEEDAELGSFGGDLMPADFSAWCGVLDGRDVVEYEFEGADVQKSFSITQAAPHQLLAARIIDPALQSNFRVSISYESPLIEVDDSLPRASFSWDWDFDVNAENERGGLLLDASFNDMTEWVPLSEVELHLLRGDSVIGTEKLEDAAFDFGGGNTIEFRDRDANGLLSEGDQILADLAADLDFAFFDAWADDYA